MHVTASQTRPSSAAVEPPAEADPDRASDEPRGPLTLARFLAAEPTAGSESFSSTSPVDRGAALGQQTAPTPRPATARRPSAGGEVPGVPTRPARHSTARGRYISGSFPVPRLPGHDERTDQGADAMAEEGRVLRAAMPPPRSARRDSQSGGSRLPFPSSAASTLVRSQQPRPRREAWASRRIFPSP